ncbi:DapH/DapD/GlmU-related protein [Chishuiella sp.]|uniref:DapH/DapD/GlmU-related protein n=1 Tax=Chishuiella sp. TaxID=1969467 RepID=UPI0028AFE1A2|nr:DapH/DapD/GlmU-related protein [Chishuiella sp.]
MDLSNYKESKPKNFKRILWYIVNGTIFRCLPSVYLKYFRNLLLRLFGAKIPMGVLVYPSCKIYAPWNLEMKEYSCIGPNTEIYNKAKITIGKNSVISQGAFLCSASHDVNDKNHSLIIKPIILEDKAWVGADAFIGMGVTIGEGAVVGARAAVFKNVEPWTIVGGNPAKFIKNRVINE